METTMYDETAARTDDGFGGEDDAFAFGEETVVDNADALRSGGFVNKPCWCHIEVADVEVTHRSDPEPGFDPPPKGEYDGWKKGGQVRQLKLTLRVLAGTDPSQKSRVLTHREDLEKWDDFRSPTRTQVPFDPTDAQDERRLLGLKNIAFALGMIDLRGKGTVKWGNAALQQCIVQVVDNKRSESGGVRTWSGNFYPVGDPKVKDVPVDVDSLAAAGLGAFASDGGGAGGGPSDLDSI